MNCDCAALKIEMLSQRKLMVGWFESLMNELQEVKSELSSKFNGFNSGEQGTASDQPLNSNLFATEPFPASDLILNSRFYGNALNEDGIIASSNRPQPNLHLNGELNDVAGPILDEELLIPKIEPDEISTSMQLEENESIFDEPQPENRSGLGLGLLESVGKTTRKKPTFQTIAVKNQAKGKQFKRCTECSFETHRTLLMKSHLTIHSEDNSRSFVCDQCDHRFKTKSHLLRHKVLHTGEKPFKCQYCQKSFSRKDSLNLHIVRHKKDKSFICHICDYRCLTASELREHAQRDHTEKSFACKLCDYKCTESTELEKHSRSHAEKRKRSVSNKHKAFKCDQCAFSADKTSELQRHQTSHTRERPFQCDYCDYRAYRQWHIERHTKTQHKN